MALAAPVLLSTPPAATSAGPPAVATVAQVESLLPSPVRGKARIVYRDDAGSRVAREGGGFICVADSTDQGRLSINCHHEAVHEMFLLEREVTAAGFRGDGFRTEICRRGEVRGVTVADGSLEIMTSLAIQPDGSLAEEATVYHLLWFPHETTESLGIADTDPGDGAPWLHRAGTCQAHVMWSETRRMPRAAGGRP